MASKKIILAILLFSLIDAVV